MSFLGSDNHISSAKKLFIFIPRLRHDFKKNSGVSPKGLDGWGEGVDFLLPSLSGKYIIKCLS